MPSTTRNLFGRAGRILIEEGWPQPTVRVGRCAVTVESVSGVIEQVEDPELSRRTLTLGPIGSEGGTLEVFFPYGEETEVRVRRGCFSGTLAEFARQAATHESKEHRERYAKVVRALELIAEAVR